MTSHSLSWDLYAPKFEVEMRLAYWKPVRIATHADTTNELTGGDHVATRNGELGLKMSILTVVDAAVATCVTDDNFHAVPVRVVSC